MKRLGRILGSLFAVALTVASLQAVAAETRLGGRDFNHMTTGFPLSGGHATAACETCHAGGVFKGTPRNCDGCHAVGKRILATPKSNAHVVTDAPCDTCHFNTSTWFGARYNHGTAIPGQCMTCHNGRITTGRPGSHNAGLMLTASCDSCHRTSAFLPASWNHVGVAPGTCESAGCHVVGSNQYNRSSSLGTRIGKPHTGFTFTGTQSCDVCHTVVRWTPAMHMPQSGTCKSCHNGSGAEGMPTGHIATTDECNQCHTSTLSWLPALDAKPQNHIPYNAGVQCSSCHPSAMSGAALHTHVPSTCVTCHLSSAPSYLGVKGRKSLTHEDNNYTGSDCTGSGCHSTTNFSNWD